MTSQKPEPGSCMKFISASHVVSRLKAGVCLESPHRALSATMALSMRLWMEAQRARLLAAASGPPFW